MRARSRRSSAYFLLPVSRSRLSICCSARYSDGRSRNRAIRLLRRRCESDQVFIGVAVNIEYVGSDLGCGISQFVNEEVVVVVEQRVLGHCLGCAIGLVFPPQWPSVRRTD